MSTIPAGGPYKGVISTVSQLIRDGNQKKYVVLNSEGYSLSEDKREHRVSLRILASHVIRSLSFELVDSEKLEEVSNALEYFSKRSIEKGNERGVFC